MATRLIKDAKDLTTNELIYFKGHAKATYLSNGSNIEDAFLAMSSRAAYPELNHGTSSTTYTLEPNVFHVWGTVSNLTLTLGSEVGGVANEYLFQFTSGSTATTLALPDTIKYETELTIEANKTYQISILKNLATVLAFSN